MTHTKPSLQEQIAELTAKHELQEYADNLLPALDKMTILSSGKKRIIVRAKTIDEFKQAFSALPPTNHTTLIGSATSKEKVLNVPYRVDIDNPASPNQYHNFKFEITYRSNNIEVNIEMPIGFINEFTSRSDRNVSDSEYHYFTGVSEQKLRTMKVMCYNFKGAQISWYGGNKTLTDENTINEIIHHLSK